MQLTYKIKMYVRFDMSLLYLHYANTALCYKLLLYPWDIELSIYTIKKY